MAVTRIQAIHSERSVRNSLNYSQDKVKSDITKATGPDPGMKTYDGTDRSGSFFTEESDHLHNALSYSSNTRKTTWEAGVDADGKPDLLISGHHCSPLTAESDFHRYRDRYYQMGNRETVATAKARRPMRAKLDENGTPLRDDKGELIYDPSAPILRDPKTGKVIYQTYEKQKEVRNAYMWVLSFPGKNELGYELDPRLVHQLSQEFVTSFLDDYACTISTHVNTDHYHSHVMQCAYSIDGTKKFRDCQETLQQARDIMDELSQKMGIPIIINPGKEPGVDWYEWKKRQENRSWKQQMRLDIRQAAGIARSPEEFKKLLTAVGYRIRETDKHYTFTMPDTDENGPGCSCRDVRLNCAGDSFDYTKVGIKKRIEREAAAAGKVHPERETVPASFDPSGERKAPALRAPHIYISRYTIEGRKRTALELILIEALKIVALFMDAFQLRQPPNDHPIYRNAKWKTKQLEDALSMVQHLDVQDKEHLSTLTNQAGIVLSQLKKQAAAGQITADKEEETLQNIEEALGLIRMATAVGFSLSGFELHSHTPGEIRTEKAKLTPMTPGQRRELYQLLSASPVYRLKCKYDELTYKEGAAIIAFLRGKTAERPEMLYDREHPASDAKDTQAQETADQRSQKEMFFRARLSEYPLDTQLKLDHCRELLNRLGALGISPDHLEESKTELQDSLAAQEKVKKDLEQAKTAYRDLKRLAYTISLAEDPAFTRGPLYDKEKAQDIEKTVSDMPDKKSEEALPKEKGPGVPPVWSVPDPYFDRT